MNNNYNHEFQKLIIRGLLSDNELYSRCQNILNPSYFDQQFRTTVAFIHDYAEKYNAIPTGEQIKAETTLEIDKLVEYREQDQQYFLDTIEKFCKHKALVNAIFKSSEYIEKGNEGEIESLIRDAMLVGLQKDMGLDYFENPRERLEELKNNIGKIKTGWDELDKALYNVDKGELMIFAAPSGGGKSVSLQNLALNFAEQGYTVIVITMEINSRKASLRMDMMVSGIPSDSIFKRLDDVELRVKLQGKKSGMIKIKDFPETGTTTNDIRAYLKEFEIVYGKKADIVLVDHMDNMSPNSKKVSAENLFVKDHQITTELRQMSKESQVLTITASQLNRGAIDESMFDHSHIQGGITKIQTADNVIGIRNTESLRNSGMIQFQLLKTRNSGGVGKQILLGYDPDTLRISNLPPQAAGAVTNQSKILGSLGINRKNASQEVDTTPVAPTTEEEAMAHAQSLRDLIKKTKK